MKRSVWTVVALIIVFVVGIGFLWLFLFGAESPVGRKIIDIAEDVGVDAYYGDVPTGEQDIGGEASGETLDRSAGGGSGGGGGGSGASDGGKESSGDNCQMIQIAYSLKNFEESSLCVENGTSGCINLFVTCSLKVYHEDSKASGGDFGIRFEVLDSNESVLDSLVVTDYLEYGQSKLFDAEFNILDSSGVDENSGCTFSSETIPKREYCG